ncbi:MAG: hypothetical protein NTW06_02205, partial [Candidatus Falkowbacteria bacterium]|nr:hypothetical protein [Candidatus Falkowbacteria bacterium]
INVYRDLLVENDIEIFNANSIINHVLIDKLVFLQKIAADNYYGPYLSKEIRDQINLKRDFCMRDQEYPDFIYIEK